MQYIDVPQFEAEDKDGKIKPGYEKWAYSWKKVIPDTPEEIADRKKPAKAMKDLKDLIVIQDADKSKVKIEDILNRLHQIEILINAR